MLAITGGKGGCGKSTTALGLAAAWAGAGERPLVVDCDCEMPNLHTMAGTPRTPALPAVGDGAAPERVAAESDRYPGVRVLPAGDPEDLLRAAPALRGVEGRVVLDCPAGSGPAATAPLRVADRGLLVSTPTPQSLEDAAKSGVLCEALGASVAGVALTRAADRADAERRARARLDWPVLAALPPIETDPESGSVGRTSHVRLAQTLRKRNL